MLSKCDSVTLRRKKFSDFEEVDPTLKNDADKIYLAGYLESVDGERVNVKLPSTLFFKNKFGDVITDLDSFQGYDDVVVKKELYQEKLINVAHIKYNSSVDFLQVNKIQDNMFNEIEGRKYLCVKFAADMPIGSTYRIYLPNFPFERGVLLFPTAQASVAEDNPIEVFYNVQDGEFDTQNANDFYFTMIHLADPKTSSGEDIVLKTKVIRVLNIESDE